MDLIMGRNNRFPQSCRILSTAFGDSNFQYNLTWMDFPLTSCGPEEIVAKGWSWIPMDVSGCGCGVEVGIGGEVGGCARSKRGDIRMKVRMVWGNFGSILIFFVGWDNSNVADMKNIWF